MSVIFRLIGAVLTAYMLLIFVRILLTWFSTPDSGGKAVEVLHRITDPYLSWFHRFSFLRAGRLDFSPIAAVIVLVVVLNVVNTLSQYGRITVGIILALVAAAVGSAFFFVVGFFLLLTIVRAVSVFVGSSSIHPFWLTVDTIINPVLAQIQRLFFRNRTLTYRNGLVAGAATLAAVFFIGKLLLGGLVTLLSAIPF